MKERIVMQGVYPERCKIAGREGRLVVEKTQYADGLITVLLTVEAGRSGSFSLSASNVGKLGEYLAKRPAAETLVDLEDALRDLPQDGAPSDACEACIKLFRARVEVLLENS